MDKNFRDWLSVNHGYSNRVVSNICSRLKRAQKLTNAETIKSAHGFAAVVKDLNDWSAIPTSSKSGILRAVHLYDEFLNS